MHVEPITSGMLETFQPWWLARDEGEMTASILPPDGAVAIDETGPVAAVWMYRPVGCEVVFLDWMVTRPGISQATARKACRSVCRYMSHLALSEGKRHVFASVGCAAMAREAQNAGFRIASTGNTHLVTHL